MRATESHDLVLNDVIVPFENFVETKHKPQPNGWILHIPSVYLGIAQREIMLLSLPKRIP